MNNFKKIYLFVVFISLLLTQSCKESVVNDNGNIDMPINSRSGRINSLLVDEPYGFSVAISADGTTGITGNNPHDDDFKGSASIYVRNGNTWSLQANLIGSSFLTDFRTQLGQGVSVSISANGNTAIVAATGSATFGGGTAFIYSRTGTTWIQQASISDITCGNNQISITSDGNTVVMKKRRFGNEIEKLLIYKRTGNNWNPSSSISVDTTLNTQYSCRSFAISGNGNIIALSKGKPRSGDIANYDGELDVYARLGTTWVKQASALKPSLNSDSYNFGQSLSISDAGTSILVGTEGLNFTGGAYLFSGILGTWIQSGNKLTSDIDPTKFKFIGSSVALSGDGSTAVVDGSLIFNNFADRKNVLFVYSTIANTWKRQGDYIISNVEGPGLLANIDALLGYSVSVSFDGKTIMSGNSTGGGINILNAGYIEFFNR